MENKILRVTFPSVSTIPAGCRETGYQNSPAIKPTSPWALSFLCHFTGRLCLGFSISSGNQECQKGNFHGERIFTAGSKGGGPAQDACPGDLLHGGSHPEQRVIGPGGQLSAKPSRSKTRWYSGSGGPQHLQQGGSSACSAPRAGYEWVLLSLPQRHMRLKGAEQRHRERGCGKVWDRAGG